MKIRNSDVNGHVGLIVTVIGRLADGTHEDFVGLSCHASGIFSVGYEDSALIYIAPDEDQIAAILKALDEGRTSLSALRDSARYCGLGGSHGGYSHLDL